MQRRFHVRGACTMEKKAQVIRVISVERFSERKSAG